MPSHPQQGIVMEHGDYEKQRKLIINKYIQDDLSTKCLILLLFAKMEYIKQIVSSKCL